MHSAVFCLPFQVYASVYSFHWDLASLNSKLKQDWSYIHFLVLGGAKEKWFKVENKLSYKDNFCLAYLPFLKRVGLHIKRKVEWSCKLSKKLGLYS